MFKGTRIKWKLMLAIMLTSMVVLVLMTGGLAAYEFFSFRRTVVRNVETLAEVLAPNLSAAITFNDTETAHELLVALRAEEDIVAAALYDDEGALFTRYPATASLEMFPEASPEGYYFHDSHLYLFEPVVNQEETVGTLFLRSNLETLYTRLSLYGGSILLGLGGAFLVALVLSSILQKTVSRPIGSLASTAKLISEQEDYTVRAEKLSHDELGVLTDAFNHMLAQIHQRDAALRESESLLRAVVETAVDAIITIDEAGVVRALNPAAEAIFGYPAKKIIGSSIGRLIPQLYPQNTSLAFAEHVIQQYSQSTGIRDQLTGMHQSGRNFPADLSISETATGDFRLFTVIVRDVTEREAAAAEIRRLNAELEQRVLERTAELTAANQELEGFTYSVSHDLRAPLRHMISYANLLEEDFRPALPEEARQFLSRIRHSAENMSQLIDDLLNLARIGRQSLQLQKTDLNRTVNETLEELRSDPDYPRVRWIMGQLPVLECDPGLIRQVFFNLICNAIKYSRVRQEPVIEIGQVQSDQTQAIFVRDNGVGFDMKYVGKVFAVFQRLHRAEQFEGTGIGLATVQKILQKHGGQIWAEAIVDKGATFYFTLPGPRDSSGAVT